MQASFLKMIYADLLSETMAFLKATEEHHRLIYIEKPNLEKLYKTLIGNYEQSVMAKELEAELSARKVELIQAAINRREPIDMEAIEAMLAEERQKRLEQINGAGGSDKALTGEDKSHIGELSPEEMEELQHLYKDITASFHPEINTQATIVQKELYQKALEAYKNQDLEAMKLIHSMLFHTGDDMDLDLEVQPGEAADDDTLMHNIVEHFLTDYELARSLYPCFIPAKEDEVLRVKQDGIHQKLNDCLQANEMLQKGFPFNAREVIENESKRGEYLASLRFREESAMRDIESNHQKIAEMAGEVSG